MYPSLAIDVQSIEMLTAAVCLLALAAPADYRKNLSMFMEAERAFARSCAISGFRNSFIEWFAEDGLGFTPHPVKQKEALSKLPEEERPFKSLLSWEPKIADCSSVGDLGYTTGPFRLIDLSGAKPIQYGAYFSVWKRQKDGSMKVVLDFGTPMTTAPTFPDRMRVQGAPSPAFVTMDLVDRAKNTIAGFETDIAKSTAGELGKTLALTYTRYPIVYRPNSAPILTATEATKWWDDAKISIKDWQVLETRVAESGDFAYCYGKYSADQDGKTSTGYFAHVWKCELGRGWHLVGDVMSVIP